jgi:hypothetical protein
LIKDETVKFVLTVSNPSGPAPTASDLTFFLNGTEDTEETTTIAAIGSLATSTQRFLLTWIAKTTANYPTVTLQNLTLRFRDAQQATSWTKLARIDVAEWEGMIAGIPDGLTQESWVAKVASHLNGKSVDPFELAGSNRVSANRYRGPRALRLLDSDGRTEKGTATISTGVRYPLMIIARNSNPLTYVASRIEDISSPNVVSSRCLGYLNKSAHGVTLTAPNGVIVMTGSELKFHTLPDREDDPNFYGLTGFITGRTDLFYDRRVEAPSASQVSRNLQFGFIENGPLTPEGLPTAQASLVSIIIGFEKSIRAHSAGSLEQPSLPLPPKNLDTPELLPMSSGQWHKITLKAGPDTTAASNGIGLWLRKGESGDADPQPAGFTLKVQGDNGAFEDLTVPQSGKIPLAANSPNWQRLTSPSGLTVFLKRDETVTDIHELSLQLLTKHDWQPEEAVKIAAIDTLPLDVLPDPNMAGVVGDVVKSSVVGSGVKHFVSPKKTADLSQDYVVLKVTGVTADQITPGHSDQIFEWSGGEEMVPSEPLKRRVKRDTAEKYEVQIRLKKDQTIVQHMNVWVVWSIGEAVGNHPVSSSTAQIQTGDGTIGAGLKISGGYDFKFLIQPQRIFTETERPNLSGPNSHNGIAVDPPGSGQLHVVFNVDLKGGVDKKWDVSRRFRAKVFNPYLYTKSSLDKISGTFWDSQPVAEDLPASYPADIRIGNDDSNSLDDEENNPYVSFVFPKFSHVVGEITSSDQPTSLMRNSTGADGDTYEERLHFGEFTRLLIGGKWYITSDMFDWRAHMKFRRSSGLWVDDGSAISTDNLGF